MVPYKHNFGQKITTDIPGIGVDRAFLSHVVIGAPAASDTDGMIDGAACSAETQTVINEFTTQPDYPRNITVVVAATAAGNIAAGNIVVTGKNIAGETITETHAVTADTAGTFTGIKAFKEVTNVTVPKQDGASVTVDIGWGKVFGLPYLLYDDELAILKLFDKSADAGTVAVSTTAIESNTFSPAGTPNGAKDIDLYLIV